MVLEVNILDAQADAFHEAQAAAVEELGHQFVGAVQAVQELPDLFAGEDGGEAFGSFGRGEEDGVNLFVEDLAVEEEDCAEGLVLGGGGDISFHSEVGQEGLDFWGTHIGGMAFVVEEDEAAHPVHVGLFGAVGVVFESEDLAELIQKFFGHRFDSLWKGVVILSNLCYLGGQRHNYSIIFGNCKKTAV